MPPEANRDSKLSGGVRRFSVSVALVVSVLLAGCGHFGNKLDMSHPKYTRVAPEISVKPSKSDDLVTDVMAVQRVQGLFEAGEYGEAEKQARSLLRSDAVAADANMLLGLILDARGKRAQAGEHYRKATELAPQRGEMLNNYGIWLCNNGRAAESLDWFQRALQAPGYPTPAAALGNSGACALQAGDRQRAERDLRQAIAIDAANPVALGAMAELELLQGNAFEARAFSERRLAAAPADVHSLQIASQIEQKLGDSDASARYVHRMKTEFPQSGTSSDGEGHSP